MAQLQFKPAGPFEVPARRYKSGARRIDEDALTAFWQDYSTYKDERGCYVLALKAGPGFTPWYVGKTTTSYSRECFTDRNVKIFNHAIAIKARGTPVLFLVVAERKRGRVNKTAINGLETALIEVAWAANPQLLNKAGTGRGDPWAIKGITTGRGRPTKAAQALKRVLNWQ